MVPAHVYLLQAEWLFCQSGVCADTASALTDNLTLRSLELASNNIGAAGVELLRNALRHPKCKLENIG